MKKEVLNIEKDKYCIKLPNIRCISSYNKSVMKRAWQDYKVKKSHKNYEEWTFSESLYWSHRTTKSLRKNTL